MQFTRPFGELKKTDAAIAGGKGASLGEMTQASIPVPPGFVVLSSAFDAFLSQTALDAEIDALLESVNHKSMHTVEHAAETIQALILKEEIPDDIAKEILKAYGQLGSEFVAVRSSATAEDGATAAWAGQLESYLNTTHDMLLENVKHCWASLFSPRAIFYRFEKKQHGQRISVAVVVQTMVESEVSGIAFSVHPVTQDHNQMIIESGFGLGEAIVSGSITPDNYVVRKDDHTIFEQTIGIQQKGIFRKKGGGNEWRDIPQSQGSLPSLSKDKVIALSKIILHIEKHYGFPVDVEWAKVKDDFFIVQSRPITTLKKSMASDGHADIWQKDYMRLFRFEGLVPYIFSYDFVRAYADLGGLAFYDGKAWMTYMRKDAMEKTLEDGLVLYGDKERYEAFKKDLHETFRMIQKETERLCAKEALTAEDVEKYQAVLFAYRKLYLQTEFFFTDRAFLKVDDVPDIAENFQTFEELKLDGRKYLNQIFLIPDSFFSALLRSLSAQLDIPFEDLSCYSLAEIIGVLAGQTRALSADEIARRKESFVIFAKKDGIRSLAAHEAVPIIREIQSPVLHAAVLKGQIAHAGRVRAAAKVITINLAEYEKISHLIKEMEQGQILVAETTEPAIIAACEKASAIVTNQGGMMSHAAIVAREMDIPCIVGTSVATEVIQDGDIIEVDGDAGEVRIISRYADTLNVIDGVRLNLVISRNMSFWHECLSTLGHYHNMKDFGIDSHFLIPFITLNGTQTHVFADMPSFRAYQSALFELLDSKERIAELKAKYALFAEEFLESLARCKADLTPANWASFEKQYMRYCAGLFPTAALGRRGGELLIERLKEIGIPDTDISSTIATITYPTEHTPLFDSQMDLLAVAVKVQEAKISKKEQEKELAVWLGKYGSIPVNFCDEPWTMEDAHAQLGNMLLKECKKEFKALEVSHNERVRRAQKRIEEIADARISLLAHLMQEATLMNEFRKNVFCRVSLGYRSIFEQVAKKCGLSAWRDCFYLHPDEVRSVIAGKKLSFKNISKERELMGATMANGALVPLDTQTLTKLEKYVQLQLGKGKTSEVTGTTMEGSSANSGIVRGIAKIILHSQDFKKLLPGEILVTTMTSVDFVPVMERAAAFVTNEGGITSHASIVAREMNKPCVIGTKVATQMIKDGDMIEVDGDKGIVTILEKK